MIFFHTPASIVILFQFHQNAHTRRLHRDAHCFKKIAEKLFSFISSLFVRKVLLLLHQSIIWAEKFLFIPLSFTEPTDVIFIHENFTNQTLKGVSVWLTQFKNPDEERKLRVCVIKNQLSVALRNHSNIVWVRT